MRAFHCPRCDHDIPSAYKRSHESWHTHAPAMRAA